MLADWLWCMSDKLSWSDIGWLLLKIFLICNELYVYVYCKVQAARFVFSKCLSWCAITIILYSIPSFSLDFFNRMSCNDRFYNLWMFMCFLILYIIILHVIIMVKQLRGSWFMVSFNMACKIHCGNVKHNSCYLKTIWLVEYW